MVNNRIKFIIITSGISLLSVSAYSGYQGTLDPTSTARIDVQITIPNRVRITGLADINFGTYSGAGNLSDNIDICVYSNMPNGRYDVTTNGDGGSSAYTIANGANTIPYKVYWNNSPTPGGNLMTTTVAQTAVTGGNGQSQTCAVGGDSSNMLITMDETDIKGQPNGTYNGTVTILIEAN